jgi:hypothetical protein
MPINLVLWMLIFAVLATAALCLMVGHAIGYRKAELYWQKRVKLAISVNKVERPLTVHSVQGQHVRRKS